MFIGIWDALQPFLTALGKLSLAEWGVVIGIMLAPCAIASAVFAGLPFWRQWKKQRVLAKEFGAEFFDPLTINRSTRYYVEPRCLDINPTGEDELRGLYPVHERLFSAIDRFLSDDPPHKHCIILADSGMGKSSFVLNYYAQNQNLRGSRRHRLAVVPLGVRNALTYIQQIEHPKETVLFLDAFDEDAQAMHDHRARLDELMTVCEPFKRVLITCRTQFFPTADEIPRETGLIRVGPRPSGASAELIFWKLYLAPLNDAEVDAFLRRRYRWDRRMRQRAQEAVNTIPLLSVRPMLLSYIPDVLTRSHAISSAYDLYEIMVEKWIEREQPWVEADALQEFSERLAVDLHCNREARGTERIHYRELKPLAEQWGIPLEDWKLRGRSLLNNDAEGHYKFAHRSIMEYLALKRFLKGERPTPRLPLTDQMSVFLRDLLVAHRDLKGSYLMGADLQGARLQEVNLEAADLEAATLQGADLENATLKHANLLRANLQDANLQGADLRGAVLQGAVLTNATYDERTRGPNGLDDLIPGVHEWDRHVPVEWTNRLGMVFVQIPSGTFLMGASESDTTARQEEKPAHAVWLPQPFYLGKYPVTQGQWEQVMGSNPSRFTGDADRPVESVSWEDAQQFLTALNALEPGAGYCLPTEAQWEFACRAGGKGSYFFGDDATQLREYAWYSDNSDERTHLVGQKLASPWGLHDMNGHVWEWVEDWFRAYSEDAQVNPSGPESGSDRVFRGGAWYNDAEHCRSSFRNGHEPGYRNLYLGFRLARLGPLPFDPLTLGEEPAEPQAELRDTLQDGTQGPMMAWLPGGVFRMGEDDGVQAEAQPAHEVEVGAFSIGQYPVTFEEYDRFCEATEREPPDDEGWGRGVRPVILVSWEDAAAYCEWLSEETGVSYRLPMEAEWEYACRAGSHTRYAYGDSDELLGEYAWFHGNAEGMTHPVGEKRPNSWRLYDVHGNVWEWVGDWFGAYSADFQHKPSGPETGSNRVIRGGAWDYGAEDCRSSIRYDFEPGSRSHSLGFRLARDGAWPSDSMTLGGAKAGQEPGVMENSPSAIHRVLKPFEVFQDAFEDGESAPEVVYIPGGVFTMGDLQGNGKSAEQPVHEVALDAFGIGRYPITVAEYMRFVTSTSNHYPMWLETGSEYHLETGANDLYRRGGVSVENGASPVVGISWNDAVAYCRWLSEQTGEGYRLLTEAQWEYACRAGSRTAYGFGNDGSELGDYAWYSRNAGSQLQLIGQKTPNAWGLYDMHGNVWEWVEDWFGAYSADPQHNPSGPESGSYRVVRGGAWYDVAGNCRSSVRYGHEPGNRRHFLGFRLARQV